MSLRPSLPAWASGKTQGRPFCQERPQNPLSYGLRSPTLMHVPQFVSLPPCFPPHAAPFLLVATSGLAFTCHLSQEAHCPHSLSYSRGTNQLVYVTFGHALFLWSFLFWPFTLFYLFTCVFFTCLCRNSLRVRKRSSVSLYPVLTAQCSWDIG